MSPPPGPPFGNFVPRPDTRENRFTPVVIVASKTRDRVSHAFHLRETNRRRDLNDTQEIIPRDWQIEAALQMIEQRDCFIVTATSSGKSLCYLTALIANPGKIIIAIFPLLSLMMDQVQSAQRLGVRACRITQSTMREDKDLITKVANELFELVCVGPEFVDPSNGSFARIIHSSPVRSSLMGIVVDESHLVYTW